MRKTNFGIFGLIVEIVFLCIGGFIYLKGLGAGPQGVVPMLTGVTIAGIGLLIGGILGVTSLMKEEGTPIVTAVTIILPLVLAAMFLVRRMGPL